MTIASVNSSAAPQIALSAQQAAKAQYLRTGIDKDAAAGDPDHDAPRKVNLTPTAGSGPSARLSSSAVTLANTVPSQATSSAAATAAYTGKAG